MVDVFLMRAFLRALPRGARLILVGDADQLPSRGRGQRAGRYPAQRRRSPRCGSTEIFRQSESSLIVRNAHAINYGEMPVLHTRKTAISFSSATPCIPRIPPARWWSCCRAPAAWALHEVRPDPPARHPGALAHQEGRVRRDRPQPPCCRPPSTRACPEKPDTLQYGETHLPPGRQGDAHQEQLSAGIDGRGTLTAETGTGVFNGDMGVCADASIPRKKLLVVFFDDGRHGRV